MLRVLAGLKQAHGGALGVPAAVCPAWSFKKTSQRQDPMQDIPLGSKEEVRNGDRNCREEAVQSKWGFCQNKAVKGTAVTRTDPKLEDGYYHGYYK